MTIKDIAKLSGVSVTTVSRVLNDHPDVNEEVRARVLKIVGETGYIPNNSARQLSSISSNNIGLIVRGYANPFYADIIIEIEKKSAEAGYTLVMQQIGATDDEVMTAAMMERDKKLRGIIFLGGNLDYTPERVISLHVPYVFCSFANTYGNLDPRTYSSVSIDDRQVACDAVRYLIEKGHKKIAVLLSQTGDASISQIRYEGYEKALRESGIKMEAGWIISANSYEMKDAYIAVSQWLDSDTGCTAIFSIADNMAIAAMKAMHDKGIKTPDDMSVISIDGIEMTRYTIPQLSSFRQPMQRLGSRAVEILHNILAFGGTHCQEVLSVSLQTGFSVKTQI